MKKKKIGLNTLREALKMQWKRWHTQRFDPGTGPTKNEMEIGTENRNIISERWLKKAAEWNPDLSSRYRIKRTIGRPRKMER